MKYLAFFRWFSAVFLMFLLLYCSGDDTENDVFEGWERPVPPSVEWETEEKQTLDQTMQETTPSDTETPKETLQETVTDPYINEENHTQPPEHTPNTPVLEVIDRQIIPGEGSLYAIGITCLPEDGIRGLLFTLHISGDQRITAITPGDGVEKLNFSYIINDDCAAVLLDGKEPIQNLASKILCYVAVSGENEEVPFMVTLHEYA